MPFVHGCASKKTEQLLDPMAKAALLLGF